MHTAHTQLPLEEEGSPAPPIPMWLTHAASGESIGQKMCAGLNPETQPLRRRAAFEGGPPSLKLSPGPLFVLHHSGASVP